MAKDSESSLEHNKRGQKEATTARRIKRKKGKRSKDAIQHVITHRNRKSTYRR